MKKMTIAEIESIEDGRVGIGTDFFPVMDSVYPWNYYDYIVFSVKDRPSYYLGTAGARSSEGLKPGGELLVDINHAVVDIDAMKHMIGMFLTYVGEKNGIYIFRKDIFVEQEKREEIE